MFLPHVMQLRLISGRGTRREQALGKTDWLKLLFRWQKPRSRFWYRWAARSLDRVGWERNRQTETGICTPTNTTTNNNKSSNNNSSTGLLAGPQQQIRLAQCYRLHFSASCLCPNMPASHVASTEKIHSPVHIAVSIFLSSHYLNQCCTVIARLFFTVLMQGSLAHIAFWLHQT